MTSPRRESPDDTFHGLALDALYDDEIFADRIWADLLTLSWRRRLSQPLEDLRQAAWNASCAIERQRRSVEAEYGL